jgi:hypothetical protein
MSKQSNCPVYDCAWVFSDLTVQPLIGYGSLVSWLLHPRFRDPSPYLFTLQVSNAGTPNADDWEPVSNSPLEDVFSLEDPVRRLFGKHTFAHYRVKLETSIATYFSAPVAYHNIWDYHDRQRIKNIFRQERVRLIQGRAGVEGYLLKRRNHGPRCTECIDIQTQESRNPQCPVCYGTEYLYGYYPPYPCFYVEKSLESFDSKVSEPRNTTNSGQIIKGRMLNIPPVHSFDIWVEKATDLRWVLRGIQSVADIKGRPVVVSAMLALLPFTHPVYQFTIADQRS